MKITVKERIEDIKKDIAHQKSLLKHYEDHNMDSWSIVRSVKENLKYLLKDLRHYTTKCKETDIIQIGRIEL